MTSSTGGRTSEHICLRRGRGTVSKRSKTRLKNKTKTKSENQDPVGILECTRDVLIRHREVATCPSAVKLGCHWLAAAGSHLTGLRKEEFRGSRWRRMRDESRGRERESPQVHVWKSRGNVPTGAVLDGEGERRVGGGRGVGSFPVLARCPRSQMSRGAGQPALN